MAFKFDKQKVVKVLPFVMIGYFANKLAQAFTTSTGSDAGEIITNGLKNIAQVFHNPLPSLMPVDLLVGVAGAALIKLYIYVKAKNAKKYRKGSEYGSARWGNANDIKPYMAEKFEDNVIPTETERLTMEGRPAAGPKYARNKNILVVGGSGSGTGTSVKKRDAFNSMIADCENGKIELIITKEVSRFARNTVDTLCFTRKLTALGIRVIFMNDGIDTSDKDGELRLTIMASIAQEESRKISERVKWGIRRKMENGWVYGHSEMLGYRTHDGKLEIVPEEAEVVRRIFHSYVYEGKGCHTIANELNAAGLFTVKGKMWREDGVCRILKNDKYVGDLTQWKHYSTDFLTKRVLQNNGDNPDTPLVKVPNHHEAIISREIWDSAQKQVYERGLMSREGKNSPSTTGSVARSHVQNAVIPITLQVACINIYSSCSVRPFRMDLLICSAVFAEQRVVGDFSFTYFALHNIFSCKFNVYQSIALNKSNYQSHIEHTSGFVVQPTQYH